MTDQPPQPADEPTRTLTNPAPFVAAVVLFVTAAVLAFVFLGSDDDGRLVRPVRVDPVSDTEARALLELGPVVDEPGVGCEVVVRAQVDLAEEAVFVEFVVDDPPAAEGTSRCPAEVVEGPDGEPVRVERVTVVLPEAIGDRPLRPGIGRLRLPCSGGPGDVVCAPD